MKNQALFYFACQLQFLFGAIRVKLDTALLVLCNNNAEVFS